MQLQTEKNTTENDTKSSPYQTKTNKTLLKITLNLELIDKKNQRNNSWKPEFVYSFSMGNIIFVKFLSQAIARDKMQRK